MTATLHTPNGHAASKAAVLGNRNRKPPIRSLDRAEIPPALAYFDRFVSWEFRWDQSKNGGRGKYDKPPINSRTGGAGSSTDTAKWSSLDEALEAQRRNPEWGIGFALGEVDGGACISGIDLDDCRNPETGEIAEWALGIIRLFDSYTEISPSGTGVKILFFGRLPAGRRKAGNVECYSEGRYFTITGQTIEGGPTELRDATIEAEQFFDAYMADAPPNESGLSDRDLAAVAVAALSPQRADNYDDWIRVGMAAKSVSDDLIGEWKQFSAASGKYSEAECDQKWKSFRGGGLTLGSLIYWARQDGWTPPTRAAKSYALSDIGNAERFAAQHSDAVRFCHAWGKWFEYDGRRWALDAMGGIARRAVQTVRGIYSEAAAAESLEARDKIAKHAIASERRERINSMIALAQSVPPLPVAVESLDADGWALNCLNGTVDLRTGELRGHRREDYLTKVCPVEYPSVDDAPKLWLDFLNVVFAGNAALIRYVQCLVGSWLPGEVLEHLLPIFYGNGANGKSVFIETICGALGGDYAMKAPADFLTVARGERHPTSTADLYGKRLVAAVETDDGCRLAESLVKELTGGDTLRARRMREDFWQFTPSHSLVLSTNHRPVIRGADAGIWRRIHLVPFNVSIPPESRDKQLARKLRAEWPAILRWAVAGCLAWQRDGLEPPDEVKAATGAYKAASDVLAKWLDDCCERVDGAEWKAGWAYRHFRGWCEDSGIKPMDAVQFSERLLAVHHFEKSARRRDGYYYLGLKELGKSGEQW